ncbi:MAG: hypothetical protein LBI82_00770 [Dysgonamonadaceae bacterium]|jgi:hypothetical protein|nr:hypothetical protein [Dysgonamonadaceae bacterium]
MLQNRKFNPTTIEKYSRFNKEVHSDNLVETGNRPEKILFGKVTELKSEYKLKIGGIDKVSRPENCV